MMEKQACYRIEKRPSSGEPHQSNALEFLKKPYFSIRGHSIQLSTSKHIVAFSPTIHDSSYSSNKQIPNSSISTLPDIRYSNSSKYIIHDSQSTFQRY